MRFSYLLLAIVFYCCHTKCWALKKKGDIVTLQSSKWNIVENLMNIDNSRITDAFVDTDFRCARNKFRCDNGYITRKKCKKTCDLCGKTPNNIKVCSPCNQHTSGMKFTHESDCKKFIWCVHGKPTNSSCPGGTHFNNQTKDCGHIWNTPCVKAQYTNSDGSCNPSGVPEPQANSKCGIVKRVNRIIGGQETVAHQYPWMATIVSRAEPQIAHCGGSLINNRWIMTAAHCFYFNRFEPIFKFEDTRVLLGHHNLLLTSVKQYTPKRLIRHQNFKAHDHLKEIYFAQYANDIALLELTSPVQFSEAISPVCLPTNTSQYRDVDVTAIGYGEKGFHGKIPKYLNEVKLTTITNNKCKHIKDPKNPKQYKKIPSTMICAWYSPGKNDICQGDSGGPLLTLQNNLSNEKQYVQIGIVSVGTHPCGRKGMPSVYTRVSKYRTWIEKNMDASNTNGYMADIWSYV